MGYTIWIRNRYTKEEVTLPGPIFLGGSDIPVKAKEDGTFVPAPSTSARINVTFNYSPYFYEATEGDNRFLVPNEKGIPENDGLRGIYGMTVLQAMSAVMDMIARIDEQRPHTFHFSRE